MVERPLSKPEVRGEILCIFKVKDIEYLINFLQKTTEYWILIQEKPSQKIYNLLFADWNKSFLDSSTPWACSYVAQLVELPLIKPEVRAAIPRISKVKDIEYIINFLQKTTDYWSLIQEISSKKNFNLLFADWNKSFLDSFKSWGCSSNVRALALHARCTESDALHPQN